MIGSFSGSGLGFGLAFRLEDEFTRTSADIRAEMERLDGTASVMANGVNSALNRMKIGFAALGAGVALLAPAVIGMDARQQFETYELQLTTLLKSAEKAKEVFANVAADAAENPLFDTGGMMAANTALISTFKYTAEQAREFANDIGNAIAAQSGNYDEGLKRAAEIVQRVSMSGGMSASMLQKSFNTTGINAVQMVAEYLGKTSEEMMKSTITADMLQGAFKRAAQEGGMFYNALENASSGMQGLRAELEDSISFFWVSWGTAVEPITKKFIKTMSTIIEKVQEFVASPFGQKVVYWTTVLGGFLVVLGVALVATGAFRFAVMKLALAMHESVRATILATIANKGYVRGLLAMAKHTWLTYLPMLKFLAVAGAIYLIGKKLGIWERIGKYFEGVSQAFKSFNGTSFELDGAYAAQMESEGLLGNVIALATWAIRVKYFLKGMWEEMSGTFGRVTQTFKDLIDFFFPQLNINLKNNTTDLNAWAETGKTVGAILEGVLIMLAFRMNAMLGLVGLAIYAWTEWGAAGKVLAVILGALAVVMLAVKVATWAMNIAAYANPYVLIAMAVIALIVAIVLLIVYFDEITAWFKEQPMWIKGLITALFPILGLILLLGAYWDEITEAVGQAWDAIVDWATGAWEAGKTFVKNLWEGIKSLWSEFSSWVENKWTAMLNKIKGAVNAVGNFFGADDVFEIQNTTTINAPTPTRVSSGDVQTARDTSSARAWQAWQPMYAPQYAGAGGNVNVTLEVDGAVLANVVADKNDIDNGRGGTINGR